MDRAAVALLAWLALFAGASAVLAAPASSGRSAKRGGKRNVAAPAEPDDGPRSRHSRALRKVRPDSLLKRSGARRRVVDLRGARERRRDRQVRTHYNRMAQLDVIAEVARRGQDTQLLRRVGEVRRRERRRFRLAMQRLRSVARLPPNEVAR